MRDIFIGVDGGGTKTKVLVEDGLGFELGSAISGPGNIRSVAGAWNSVNEGIEMALKKASIELNDPNYRFHVGLGLAGTEVQEAYDAFLKVPHPFQTLILDSDAYAACLGVHGNKDGAIIIVGTGVIGFQVEAGFRSRVGGWGFPHADEGGGAWMGMEALRLTFKALDGRCEKSPLLDAILEKFEVAETSPQALISFANHAKPGDFGSIAPLVLQYLQSGDPYAKKLAERAAHEIDLVAFSLERKRDPERAKYRGPLPLCLLGGVSRFIEPFLAPEIRSRLVPRQFDAAKGAIFMVKSFLTEKGKV
jgi:glucosamine kinase